MTGDPITDELVRLTDSYRPGPPPIDQLLIDGSRKRRRGSIFAVTAVTAAVVVIIATGAVLTREPGSSPQPSSSSPAPSDPIPPNTRLVGVGHAAIAVPRSWSTNQTACGTPTENTVIINVTAVPLCGLFPQPVVSSVEVSSRSQQPNYPDFTNAERVNIGGVEAFRSPLHCTHATIRPTSPGTQPKAAHFCTQATWMPEESALFIATTPRPNATRALMETLHIDPSRAAVPQSNLSGTPAKMVAEFTHNAEALGFHVITRTTPQPGFPSGSILGVSPATGTVLPTGTTLHLTLAK